MNAIATPLSATQNTAIDHVFSAKLPPDEAAEYMGMVTTISISALRGIHGDEYVKGFLQAQIDDMERPAEITALAGMTICDCEGAE